MAPKPKSKPHGSGRMAIQNKLRSDRSKFMAKLLLERLDINLIKRIMVVVPCQSSLRRRKWRRAFSCLAQLSGRVYTDKLCRSIIKKILRSLPFEINLEPGETLSSFIQAQSKRLRVCARAAKKLAAMADLETQPLGEEVSLALHTHTLTVSTKPSVTWCHVNSSGQRSRLHQWGLDGYGLIGFFIHFC